MTLRTAVYRILLRSRGILKSLQPMRAGHTGVLASLPFLLLPRAARAVSQVPYLEIVASSILPVLSAHALDDSLPSEPTFLDHIFIPSLSFIFFLASVLQHSNKLESQHSALHPCLMSLTSSSCSFFTINNWAIFMDRLLITSPGVWTLSDLVSVLSITLKFHYRLWLSILGQVSEPFCCPRLP